MPEEWEQFKIGTPSPKNKKENSDCRSFSSVSHVAHVNVALNILKEGRIKPSLVFDKSKLKDERILVCWLSPNDWTNAGGFRYGNIRFSFNWKHLIENKKFYWIEPCAYNTPACRFLITNKDYSPEEGNPSKLSFSEYKPCIPYGPWWYDETNDKHYFNSQYCLEFMFEDAVTLEGRFGLSFVDHHAKMCSMNRNNPQNCREVGYTKKQGGALFLAATSARSVCIKNLKFNIIREKSITMPKSYETIKIQQLPEKLHNPFLELWNSIVSENIHFNGRLIDNIDNNEISIALTRAICEAYIQSNKKELSALVSLFQNEDHLKKNIAMFITQNIGLDDWRLLYDIKTPFYDNFEY